MKFILLLFALLCAVMVCAQTDSVKLSPNIDEQQIENYEISIFPNPVVHTMIVEVELNLIAEQKVSLEIYNMMGKRVLTVERLSQPVEIVERGHLPEGLYSFVVKTNGKVLKSGKLIFTAF